MTSIVKGFVVTGHVLATIDYHARSLMQSFPHRLLFDITLLSTYAGVSREGGGALTALIVRPFLTVSVSSSLLSVSISVSVHLSLQYSRRLPFYDHAVARTEKLASVDRLKEVMVMHLTDSELVANSGWSSLPGFSSVNFIRTLIAALYENIGTIFLFSWLCHISLYLLLSVYLYIYL